MNKKLNVSTTTVIQTELTPLNDSFDLQVLNDAPTEQWYYENTSDFLPDRQIAPLVIHPFLQVQDPDSDTVYNSDATSGGSVLTGVNFTWRVRYWNGTAWVDITTFPSQDGVNVDYYVNGKNLVVKKNVSDPTHAVTVFCSATYTDPRDSGVGYTLPEQTLLLTCSKDAERIYPNIDILAPSTIPFNPLKDSPEITLQAKVDWEGVLSKKDDFIDFKSDKGGSEEMVHNSCYPSLDIRYGQGESATYLENQRFGFRQTSDGALSSIPNGVASIKAIKGQSVKWNQMVNQPTDTLSLVKETARTGVVVTTGTYTEGRKYYGSFYLSDCVNNDNYTMGIKIGNGNSATFFNIENGKKSCIQNFVPSVTNANVYFFINNTSSNETACEVSKVVVIDLTAMFGSDENIASALGITVADITTDTGVEAFENWLKDNIGEKLYYDFNAGTILNAKDTDIVTQGFNQWDEEWEAGGIDEYGNLTNEEDRFRSKNFISILPSKNYCCMYGSYTSSPSSRILYLYIYDSGYNFISRQHSTERVYRFTTPVNARYMKLRSGGSNVQPTYNNDTCINISDTNKNGTYEPYWKNVSHVGITTLKGKLNGQGESVVVFPDGMKKVGNIQDEVIYDNDTLKAIKRVGSLNLGTVTWKKSSALTNSFWAENLLPTNNSVLAKYNYEGTTASVTVAFEGKDMVYCREVSSIREYAIWVKDTNYTETADFKTAMNGVMLYYELETPQEYILEKPEDDRIFEWYGISNNTEVKIDTLPCYTQTTQPTGKGQNTDTIKLNAMYGENIPIILRCKRYPWDTTLLPCKKYCSITWKPSPTETIIACLNGGSIKVSSSAVSGSYTFQPIVNANGETLSAETIRKNLRFKWFARNSNSSSMITGYPKWQAVSSSNQNSETEIAKSDLRQTAQSNPKMNALVSAETYIIGAKELHNGQWLRKLQEGNGASAVTIWVDDNGYDVV